METKPTKGMDMSESMRKAMRQRRTLGLCLLAMSLLTSVAALLLTPGRMNAQTGGGNPVSGQENTNCQAYMEVTECVTPGNVALSYSGNTPNKSCVGSGFSVTASKSVSQGTTKVTTYYYNCDTTVSYINFNPTYSVAWSASGPDDFSASGSGLTANFSPTNCGNGKVIFTCSYTNDPPCDNGTSTVEVDYLVVGVASLNPEGTPPPAPFTNPPPTYLYCVSSNAAPVRVIATSCPGMSAAQLPDCWTISPQNGRDKLEAYVELTNAGQFNVVATAGTSAKTNVFIVSEAKILTPKGSVTASTNPVAAWCDYPCYHFDFQGVVTNSPGTYPLDILGQVKPSPPLFQKWTLGSGAGALTSMTGSPSHLQPVAPGDGSLTLEPIWDNDTNRVVGCSDQRDVRIYQDHLARDRVNFGVGISCYNTGWAFTAFGATIPMNDTWNCYGSTIHAYDGSGSGYADVSNLESKTLGWAKTNYDGSSISSNWPSIKASLAHGDVVIFYGGNNSEGYFGIHAHTSVSGPTMYGANNEPSVNYANTPPATWKWFECASDEYFNAVNAASLAQLGFESITRVAVRKRP